MIESEVSRIVANLMIVESQDDKDFWRAIIDHINESTHLTITIVEFYPLNGIERENYRSLEQRLKRLNDTLLKDDIQKIGRACWINLKTLLDKAFRLFFPQKVPTIGGIGGKIQVLFPWKLGSWPRRFDRRFGWAHRRSLTVHSTELRRTSWKSIKPHTPYPKPVRRFGWAFDWAHAEVSPSKPELTAEAYTLPPRKNFCRKP
jgi:hypothetical protein